MNDDVRKLPPRLLRPRLRTGERRRRRRDGPPGLAVQAARLCLPVVRDLRRRRFHMGLRTARRRDEARDPRLLVGVDGAARRHRRSRRGHPDASARVGSLRTRCGVHGSADRLQELQAPLSRRHVAGDEGAPLSTLRIARPVRGAAVQSHVQDLHGTGGGRGRRRVLCVRRPHRGSTSTSRTSSARGRRSRSGSRRSERRSATRSRRELHLSARASSSRWRCSISSSRARIGNGWRGGSTSVARGTPSSASGKRNARSRTRTSTSSPTTRPRLSTSSTSSLRWQELEGIHDRTDFDLSRHEEHSGKKLSYFDEETKERYIPTSWRRPRGRSDDADVPGRWFPGGGRGQGRAHGSAPVAAHRSHQAGRSRWSGATGCPSWRPRSIEASSDAGARSTTTAARSAGDIGGRTKRGRRSA